MLQLILLGYLKIPSLLHVSYNWVRILLAISVLFIYKNVAKTEPCGDLPLAVYNFTYYSILGEKCALLAPPPKKKI